VRALCLHDGCSKPSIPPPTRAIMHAQEVVAMLEEGIFDMQRLLEGGWVSSLKYEDEVIEDLKAKTETEKDKVRFLSSCGGGGGGVALLLVPAPRPALAQPKLFSRAVFCATWPSYSLS
jgi:hypothetical protein